MRVFDLTAAAHFTSGFGTLPNSRISPKDLMHNQFSAKHAVDEGTPDFPILRDCLLRHAETSLFISISLYRRAFDLLTTGASPWALVTFYYSSFFSASAVISMLGGFLDIPNLIIEVDQVNPGSQKIVFKRGKRAVSAVTRKGSHRGFWELYYRAVSNLVNWYPDPKHHIALTPVNNDPYWQIDTRNKYNYDTLESMRLMENFARRPNRKSLVKFLPGPLNTLYQLSRSLALLSTEVAKELKLRTDFLVNLNRRGQRRLALERFIFKEKIPYFPKQYDESALK